MTFFNMFKQHILSEIVTNKHCDEVICQSYNFKVNLWKVRFVKPLASSFKFYDKNFPGLYVLVMSRTRFWVNPHSMSMNSLLEAGAKSEV